MTQRPLVSVIMNCLNCEKYVKEAIDSVYAQTYPNWEIIFWDNASTDKSAEIAKSYDERLRYFRSPETVPLGHARNWAMEKASGEYIAFLDCDDIWLPQKLEKQIPLFEKNPKVGLVYSNTYFFKNDGKKWLLYKKQPPKGDIFKILLTRYFLSLETVVINKEVLENLSEWFDNRFNLIEEADLFIRIAHDWEVDYVNEPLAKWRVHADSWTWQKSEGFADEFEIMLEKYKKIFPNFEIKYSQEKLQIEARIDYIRAKYEWSKGKNKKVRLLLKRHVMTQKKILIPYLFSFFPYRYYKKLLQLLKKEI